MLTEEQKKVKEILLMPIECTTQETLTVFLYNNRIFSSQKYINSYDPDMSDFAVEFYKIIYKDKLKGQNNEILDERGVLINNKEFCGDTMNSYKTVVKKIKDNQKKKDWKNRYHCLANFWLLPMHIGHSSPRAKAKKELNLADYAKDKNGINDYMDKFLEEYRIKYEKYREIFSKYAEEFTPDSLGVDHFLEGIYVENNKVTEEMKFSDKEADDIVDEMCKRIDKRAELIACKEGEELYEFFFKLGIIQLVC